MGSSMDNLENFFAQYPAMISTTATVATVGAVIVALYLARRQSHSHIEVFADVNRYIAPEAQEDQAGINLEDAPLVITVTMRNVGQVPVSISYWSSFVWGVAGGRKVCAQNPAEPDFRHEPIELNPGKSASIVLSRDLPAYRTMMKDLAQESWLGECALRFPKLTVGTEIGDRFRAKLGRSLKQFLTGQGEGAG